jgi:hypothetical protein
LEFFKTRLQLFLIFTQFINSNQGRVKLAS